jgi:nucleotide-binding universal stress UspA family protein
MTTLSKCLLLPLDGTEEALKPVEFLGRLYPDRSRISIVLSYFPPPLPPAYQGKLNTPELIKRRQQLVESRAQKTRSVLDQAKKVLTAEGFLSHTIEEHVQERQAGKAREACLLADRKKVDAVLVEKRFIGTLEGFLTGDPTHGLLEHCLASPVWLTDGTIDVSHAAVCISKEDASLRAADHAAFMLSGTDLKVTLLHAARTIPQRATAPVSFITAELERWLMSPEGRGLKPFLDRSHEMMKQEGIADDRIQVTILPGDGKAGPEILNYCRKEGIGILVLGHSPPTGITGFFKGSVTKRIAADLKNMSVWITQ